MKEAKAVPRLLILFSLLWLSPLPCLAKEARLSDIVVTNTRDHLLLYFTVEDCFTPEMDQAIENGISTTFTFFVRLYEKRDWRLDRKIADQEISHTIKYDNIKKIYEVTLSEQNDKAVILRDFNEAKKLMAEVVALKVTPLTNLTKGESYRLETMAQLDKIKLPFSLHYVLFFLSLWDFETDWYDIDLRY